VAERGLACMRGSLTAANRAPAFGPEQVALEGADACQRIAAFAGRPGLTATVRPGRPRAGSRRRGEGSVARRPAPWKKDDEEAS
jgi:hypothetical protein